MNTNIPSDIFETSLDLPITGSSNPIEPFKIDVNKTIPNKKKRKKGDGSKTKAGNKEANNRRRDINQQKQKIKSQNRFNYSKKEAKESGLSYLDYTNLNRKLEVIKDNSERVRITDSFLSDRNNSNRVTIDPTKGVKHDLVGPTTENKPEGIKGIFNNSGPGKVFNKLVSGLSKEIPNSVADMMTASNMGLQTKQTIAGKLGSFLGASEVTGHNFITGDSINIDYLSNKIGKQPLSISENDGVISKFFKNNLNKYRDRVGASNLEYWKQMQIEETSKSVRQRGANINPFDSGENIDYLRQQVYGGDKKAIGNADLHYIKHRDTVQLKEVEKRIADSQNNIKNFFNPIDEAELKMLQTTQSELSERIRRIDGNYGAARLNTDAIDIPNSVSSSFEDLHNRRMEIMKTIESRPAGNLYNERSNALLKKELNEINGKLSNQADIYNKATNSIPNSSMMTVPSHTKDFTPTFGTSGYGLGFKNSMMASRAEHLTRAAHFFNPFGAGGLSAMQAVSDSFGYMGKARRMQAAQARGLAKIPHAAVPALGAAQLILGMSNNDSAGQIFEDIFATGTALAGWRAGSALGGGLGGKGPGLGRLVGLGVGGVTGLAAGFLAGTALVGGVRDVMSNESKIRDFAKKISTKETTVSQVSTNQSLTMRMASLNKLAKSGLNDRGLLLGNESSILAGAM